VPVKTHLRAVPDTNVVLASQYGGKASPNKEFFECWDNEEFQILYSDDMLHEYYLKLREHHVPEKEIKALLLALRHSAEHVPIQFFHHPSHEYPVDIDDIAFILCADNGQATHLVTYDPHLLNVNSYHPFSICQTIPLLRE